MSGAFRVVVLGGYGNFGRIVARRLARSPRLAVVVAGRDGARARAAASEIGAEALRADVDAVDFAETLRATGAGLVIHAAGPFQRQDYRVARAALAAGMHYVDLADGREFVCGITALDGQARATQCLVVAGASSVPALSSAVVDSLAPRFATMEEIDIGISASATLPGLATVEAVLGYCGKPIPRWRGGRTLAAHGWQGLRTRKLRLGRMRRWFCDCDVPDLALFPERYAVRSVRFGAGVELAPVQWSLWGLSWLVRAGIVRRAAGWAPALAKAGSSLARFGTGRSAMFVCVAGRDPKGQPLMVEWELLAERDQGREIPCIAAVVLAKKLAAGHLSTRGALPCMGLVTLGEFLDELRDLKVTTHVDD